MWHSLKIAIVNCDWVIQLQCKQAAPVPLCVFVYAYIWYTGSHSHKYQDKHRHTYAQLPSEAQRREFWTSLHCVHLMFTCEDFIKASKQCLWCTCACAKKNKHQIFGTADCRAALKFQMVSLKFGELWCSVYGTSVMQCAVCSVQCAVCKQTEDWGLLPLELPPTESLCRVLGTTWQSFNLHKWWGWSKKKRGEI